MVGKRRKTKIDYVLLGLIAVLVIWGIFYVATTSFSVSLENFDTSWHYALHQILYGLIPGVVIAFILLKLPWQYLKKWCLPLLGFNLLLMILVFVPHLGLELGGAKRWLKMGPLLVQPSELLKITSLLYLSAWFSKKGKQGKKGLAVLVSVLAILGITLLVQPDMSTLVIIAVAAIVIYFAAPTPWWHTALLIVALAVLGIGLVTLSPYRSARLSTLLHPDTDPLGVGYQAKQALISIGSGGLWGIKDGFSFGLSEQKLGFLPYPMSDSIFAVMGEEMGFVGCALFIILFIAFLWRGIYVAGNCSNDFLKLLGVGIVVWLGVQAFCNIGGLLGLLPLAGIPLPFFSYGASHLITELAGVGLLLKISSEF